jgi:DNA-binding transcriptional ArsR family regulator
VIRIEFSADDLARTRVVSTLGPFAETMLGVGSLRMAGAGDVTAPWRSARRGVLAAPVADLARFVSPGRRVQVDVFSMTGVAGSFAEGAEALLATRDSLIRDEVHIVHKGKVGGVPWLREVGTGDLSARRRMTGLMERLHRQAVAPYWPGIEAALEAERSRLQRLLAGGGLDALLSGLHPLARWSPPVLELPTAGRWSATPLYAALGGTGIVLAPSAFCPVGPVPFFPYNGNPAVLIYPALTAPQLAQLWNGTGGYADPDPRQLGALGRLIGRTRAEVLRTLADGCTTSELAARLGMSPASASQHATALREAGLVSSTRDRNRMLHRLTNLGAELLHPPDQA